MTTAVARLKVTLDDVEPKVLRRIEVPADIKLDRLHLTLQAALGWTNTTFTKSATKTSALASPIPIGPTDRSMLAKRGSSSSSKTPEPRRCAISTTSATAGNIRSRSNV